jgi:hypothetical protein
MHFLNAVSFTIQTLTVGPGISPDQSCSAGVAGFTAGGDLHPAPKIPDILLLVFIIRAYGWVVKTIQIIITIKNI